MGVRDRMAYTYILVLAILFLSVLDCESCKDKNDPKLLKWKGKHPKFQFTISGKECQKWSEDTPHKKVTVQRTKIITIAGTLTKIIKGCGAIPLTLIQGGSDVT